MAKKTGMIVREGYTLSCSQVDGEIVIPKAKDVVKHIRNTAKMDEVAREVLEKTRDRIQFMVDNGFEFDEFYYSTNKISKVLLTEVMEAWCKYMVWKGYKASAYLEDDEYVLQISVENIKEEK